VNARHPARKSAADIVVVGVPDEQEGCPQVRG
jgi:hypothetical protein